MTPSLTTALLLSLGAAGADDVNLRTKGEVWTLAAMDVGFEDDHEDILEELTRFALEARWNTEGGGRVLMGVAGEHWLQAGLDTRYRVSAWPDEVRWDRPLGRFAHLRLGQQVARWGQLEGLSLVDVLNPLDLRHGPMYAPDEQRIAVPMVRLELGPPVFRAQLYFVPWHVPNRYHLLGSDWAFYPTGLLEDLVASTGDWGGDETTAYLFGEIASSLEQQLRDAEPSAWWGYDQLFRSSGDLWEPFSGAECALRFTYSGRRGDFSVMGARVRSDVATVTMDRTLMSWVAGHSWPSLEEIDLWSRETDGFVMTEYPYTWVGGLDGAVTLGVVGLKLEAIYTSDVALTTNLIEGVTLPEVGVGVSAEYQGSTNVRFGAEAAWKRLLDHADYADIGLLARREDEGLVAGWFTLSMFRQRLEPELTAVWSPTFAEGVAGGSITYKPGDDWAVSAHSWFFFARAGTPRTVEDLVAYDGGPMGLYSDNDAVALRVTRFL